MNIQGTNNLTQQAYALVQITSSQNGGEIYYWLHPDEHTASIAQSQFTLFNSILGKQVSSHLIDSGRSDFSLSLNQLAAHKPGVYVMTLDQYDKLGTLLSLFDEKTYLLSSRQSMNPNQLKKRLVDLGYGQHDDEELYFQAQAGVVNIFNQEQVYRVIFDEDGIEEIINVNKELKLPDIKLFPLEIDLKEIPAVEIKVPDGSLVFTDIERKPTGNPTEYVFRTFKQLSKENTVEFNFDLVTHYRRDYKKLSDDIEVWAKKNYQIVLSAIDPDVIKTAMKREDDDLASVTILEQLTPIEGFADPENGFVLLGHAEILGRKQVKERKRRDDSVFVTKLEENDYIVHEDHGIGRFVGLVKSTIEGHERENLVLEYAKGDKLYVPVEMAYKVDKYVGEAKPKLQRLSGTSWVRMSRKASQESQEFAKNLLKLYAQRSLIQVEPWTVFQDADNELSETFAFTETPDQELAIKDVYEGLAKSIPMDRLVVGDVGFGKTEVALRAAYQGVLNHKQVAILCPTTLLAQQHYDTFSKRLTKMGVRVEMLSRFTGKVGKAKDKSVKQILEDMKSGDVDIVIGTHRLLSQDVNFAQMGLVIVDEEQRFGVKHKESLKKLRQQAHILTLSATPIPRTLYFSLSGLRDISTIQTSPKGRQPINTVIHEFSDELIKKSIQAELKRGGQAFYLYNKVQTIQTQKRKLQELLGAKVKIDIVHGQMPPAEMARVASQFDEGKIDVLVCTTIIENGIDIPNVNTLIVHDATKFGIGQLYQIRGRIGRGSVKAHAIFLFSESGISGVAARRLQILEEAKELGSGFQLAMRDLEMRGMGQMLGKKQSGNVQKVGLSVYGKLLKQAVEEFETGVVKPVQKSITINLPLDYGIPDALVSDPRDKVRLYRQLSQAMDPDEITAFMEPFQASIASLDSTDQQKLQHLQFILQMKLKLHQTPVSAIDYQEIRSELSTKLQLELTFDYLSPMLVDQLAPVAGDFRVVGHDKVVFSIDSEQEAIDLAQKLVVALRK
jgi:transcription-repair coupling factor